MIIINKSNINLIFNYFYMKNKLKIIFPLVLSLFLIVGCLWNSSISTTSTTTNISKTEVVYWDTEWKFEKTITEPIIKKVSTWSSTTLGDLEKNKTTILIPKNTFDGETQIDIRNPDVVPKYLGKEVKMIGSPIEITATDKSRLNKPVTITFKYNKTDIDPIRGTSNLRVTYYDGTKWEYIKPDSIDAEKWLITFTTYHFSLFWANQISDDTVITESWIHSQTIDKQMKGGINKVSDKVAEQIIDLTLEKMGISDKTLKWKVLTDVLKDDGYKGIYDSYKTGDVIDLNQKIALLAGKKIAEIADESVVQEGLKNLTEGAEDVAAVSKAAGYIAGGQYKDAAKIIGEQIADKFVITQAGKIAVEVVDYQIESWKNNEVEAAYTAFRDWSNAKFYGYNNEKNDFDTVWTQMRGVSRQLSIEAIKKENAIRSESWMPPLNEKQMDRVRESVKESYRNQFIKRSAQEEELKKEEEKLRLLVKAFKDNNLFDTTTGPSGLDKWLDYENKLNVLNHFAQKMMKDTNRFELSDKTGLIMDKAISVDDIAQGARLYFSVPEWQKKYAEFLKSRFNIVITIDFVNLAWTWTNWTITVKDVILSWKALAEAEKAKNSPKKWSSDWSCDFSIDLRQMKWKTFPTTLIIKPNGKNSWTINFSFWNKGGNSLPVTYNDWIIKWSISKDWATWTLELTTWENDKNYTIAWNINYNIWWEMKIIMNLVSNKSKPIPTQKK